MATQRRNAGWPRYARQPAGALLHPELMADALVQPAYVGWQGCRRSLCRTPACIWSRRPGWQRPASCLPAWLSCRALQTALRRLRAGTAWQSLCWLLCSVYFPVDTCIGIANSPLGRQCLHAAVCFPAGTYIDKKCPFTGDVSIRGRILSGLVRSTKMHRTIIIRRNYVHYIKKYAR